MNKKNMAEIKVVCGVVLEKDGKILLVQEKKPHCYGEWNLPTGTLEINESILQNVVKEAKEETGYDVELINLIGVYNYTSNSGHNITRFQFRVKIIGGKENFPEDEILALKWCTKKEIDNMPDENLRSVISIRPILKDYFDGKSYSLKVINNLTNKQ